MTRTKKRLLYAALTVAVVLVIDQALKVWVKTTMPLHAVIPLFGDWAKLLFTENKGMAFGMDFIGTLALCLFRLVAVAALGVMLWRTCRTRISTGFVVCLGLVLAGAAGNIFDNVLYGLIFSESTWWQTATLVPFGEGYGSVFEGRVVDMFYFPMIDCDLPNWLPIWGGEHFIFFSPIFNFADAAISCGAVAIILFYRKAFSASIELMSSSRRQGDDAPSANAPQD